MDGGRWAAPAGMKDLRRNFIAHSIDGGLYMGGIAFVAADSVLPAMVSKMGAPAWVVSLMPNAKFLGFMIVPIFFAAIVERCTRMHRYCMITGIPQRLPFLIAALILFFYGESHPTLALAAVALTPFLSGAVGGMGQGAWMQLVARTIPARRRSSLSATRNLIAAGIGIGAGFFIERVLSAYPGTTGFGILHLAAFASLALSFVFFAMIKEEVPENPPVVRHRSFRGYCHDLVDILRRDRDFRFYTVMRLFGPAFAFQVPFMAVHALDTLDAPEAFVGALVSSQIGGQVLGNLIGGWLGDRAGGRLLLVIARVLFLGMFVLGAFAETRLGFQAYFALLGFCLMLNQIGNLTLMLEIAPDDRRPTYGALAGIINGPGMLFYALAGAAFWSTYQSMWIQAVIGGFGMLVSLAAIWIVREPRSRASEI